MAIDRDTMRYQWNSSDVEIIKVADGSFAKSNGPGGKCVCPQCGAEIDHATGQPCADEVCPECGAKMTRKEE